MRGIITFIVFFIAISFGYGQEIAFYSSVDGTGTPSNPNVTTTNLVSQGVNNNPNVATTYNWETSNTINTAKYLEWTLQPVANHEINLTSIEISYSIQDIWFFGWAYAPRAVELYIDIGDGSGYNPIYINNPSASVTVDATIDLTAYNDVTNPISFRLYAYDATSAWFGNLGELNIEELPTGLNKGIKINGTVNPVLCPTTVTWSAGAWSNITGPDLTTAVIIDDVYNTQTNGSFQACSLTVNTGNILTIVNGTYIEIENDIIADGNILVNPQGAVKQNNDNAIVVENGLIQVTKETGFLNNWYEYTYWSSPVANETIGTALSESEPNRRFSFNAANFLDATMEANNNNATVVGQDDIDDNADDWTPVNAATVMTPGVGYAATHSQPFFFFPTRYQYIFEGPFNNGVITIPVYRNDAETNDNNWNLIGNPYPSAIDADLFLTANTNVSTNVTYNAALDGAIFLWSQNTAPSNTANGNENLNFATADYAVINAVGETAGGDGITPTRYIPSGQGFFVVYSDAATPDNTVGSISEGTVVFNNSMRVTGNNNQFFRTKNKSKHNKLWVNLTSDNGVFNQILIAYANGATNGYDGMAFDTSKNLSSDASAILYSNIEDEAKKFVIQGKSPSSINKDEIINIGYKTAIDVPTIYSLSIAQLEGEFLNSNAVFVKDKLLNKIHNLKDSDYNFTSEVGEFNDRFEIVFRQDALSVNEPIVNSKQLSIIEHSNGTVQFKLNATNYMTNIKIIDLQGRILLNHNANSNDETLSLPHLSSAPYIAKVTLDNNHIITKKAIKK